MYFRPRQMVADPVRSRSSALVGHILLLLVLPALVTIRGPSVAAQTATPAGPADSQDASSLTAAQEEARQLATALTGKRKSAGGAEKISPLSVIADQTMRLGKRVVLRRFAWKNVDVRLVGGEQTFASPVDEASATASEDAGRPVFLPASQAAVAIEVLGE